MTKLKQVKRRDKKIQDFAKKFPDMEQKAIAKVFHVSSATVCRALKKERQDERDKV